MLAIVYSATMKTDSAGFSSLYLGLLCYITQIKITEFYKTSVPLFFKGMLVLFSKMAGPVNIPTCSV